MKAVSAFDHPITGEKVMPGQTFDEKGLDKEELEDLKKRGYLTDGDGYKAGEKVDLSKLSSTELRAYAQGLGIDTGNLRDRTRIEGAINARQAQPAPAAEQKRATLTFGPGTRASASEETVSAEDQAKHNEEVTKAREAHEAEIKQSGDGGKKKAPPPERKAASGGMSSGEKK